MHCLLHVPAQGFALLCFFLFWGQMVLMIRTIAVRVGGFGTMLAPCTCHCNQSGMS